MSYCIYYCGLINRTPMDGKETWDKLWEISIAIIGIYFAVYTTAKDFVDNKEKTMDALSYSVPFWIVLMLALIIGMYFGTKMIQRSEKK